MITRRTALIAVSTVLAAPAFAQQDLAWRPLAPGVEHVAVALAESVGDRNLHALRIDPARNRFVLLTGAATGKTPRTARAWAREHDLIAATNLGMFHPGGLPVGYTKANGRVIQRTVTRDNSVLVFGEGSARLLDRPRDGFDPDAHANAMQGIRMVAPVRRNVWSQQPRRWSIACLAQDGEGRILFLHCRAPHSVHDFVTQILALPLGVARCMYLEGGPEATLYARAGDAEIERFGSFETGFFESDDNTIAWPLPNVLGVAAG